MKYHAVQHKQFYLLYCTEERNVNKVSEAHSTNLLALKKYKNDADDRAASLNNIHRKIQKVTLLMKEKRKKTEVTDKFFE